MVITGRPVFFPANVRDGLGILSEIAGDFLGVSPEFGRCAPDVSASLQLRCL